MTLEIIYSRLEGNEQIRRQRPFVIWFPFFQPSQSFLKFVIRFTDSSVTFMYWRRFSHLSVILVQDSFHLNSHSFRDICFSFVFPCNIIRFNQTWSTIETGNERELCQNACAKSVPVHQWHQFSFLGLDRIWKSCNSGDEENLEHDFHDLYTRAFCVRSYDRGIYGNKAHWEMSSIWPGNLVTGLGAIPSEFECFN